MSVGLRSISVLVAVVAICIKRTSAGDSVELTPATFQSKVLDSKDPFLVLFYAPWCGHCKAIFPKWAKAAAATKGIVTLAQVDSDKYGEISGKYGVKGFPTIKVFGADKTKPTDFQGAREVDGLVQGAMQAAQDVIMARLGKSGGGSGGGSGGKSEVVELTEQTFQSKVLDSEDLWLVAFTAPWCGHCKRLVPEFASASAELKGKAKLGNVDSTVHQGVAGKYGVNGYPTLKVFLGGAKDGEAVDYEGGRTASDIVAWAEEEFLKNAPAPEVLQATRQDSFEESCVSKQICFVAFLPLLQDSGKDGRLEYIETLKATAEKYKRRPFGYVWVEGTAQLDFEGTFGVGGGGYPALIAVNAKKMRFSSLKGQFSASGLSEFVNKLVAGRGTVPVNGDKLPSLVVTESWDGNDFVPDAYEEEFDLADLMDDDDDEDVSSGASKDEL